MKLTYPSRTTALCAVLALAACLAPVVNVYYGAPTEEVLAQAKKARPPLWKVSLGPAAIEEMQQVAPERLLLGLKRLDASMTNLDYLFVDTAGGKVLWRFAREAEGDYRMVLAGGDRILFSRDHRGEGSLAALDAATGTVLWSRPPEASPVYLPLGGQGHVVAYERKEGQAIFSALDARTGKVAWSREVRGADPHRLPLPVPVEAGIIHFFGRTELLAERDGVPVWTRDDIRSGMNSPPPQAAGRSLVMIDELSVLHILDSGTGKELLSAKLDPNFIYTNIAPAGEMIYLRGEAREEGGKRFRLAALRRADGKTAWTYADTEPSVSALLPRDDRLYFATPTALVSLDAASGRQVFRADAATTGRAYPVHVKMSRGKVVFIGELTIAAYDPSSGKELYSRGMTPIQDLDGCDLLIKKYQEELAVRKAQKSYSGADQLSRESAKFQNLASQNYRLASERHAEARRSGGSELSSMHAKSDSEIAFNEARIDTAFSKAYSQMAFYAAMDDLSKAMEEAFKVAELRGTLALYRFFRQTILAAYDAAEEGDYVFRPETKGLFSGITIIHLPTGVSRHVDLSPSYEEYGLWNLVDFRKGIVYHHGIGMEPSDYVFAEPFTSYRGLSKVRQYNSYLIARHVDLPK